LKRLATNARASSLRASEQYAGKTYGKTTTGGMITKLQAVKTAAAFGVPTIIAKGLEPRNISRIFTGEDVGTFFMPSRDKLSGRKHWIAYTLKPVGKIKIDDGAKNAITIKRKSLLPSGILSIEGNFGIGDLVTCIDSSGKEVARGLVSYSSADIHKIIGVNTSKLGDILGYKYGDEVINRDDLVLV